jgi:ATP-dependent DNA helicase PIF1
MFIPLSAGIPELARRVFGGTLSDRRAFLHRAILSPWNNDVNEINAHLIDSMSSPHVHELLSADEAANLDENDPTIFPPEFLHSLQPSGMPPHALRLKEGCPLLIRNLCPKHGLANGTRLLLRQVRSRVLQVDILTGSHAGMPALIPRIELQPSDVRQPFLFKRMQFPVVPAFAMSINKAQGQTFERVGVLLKRPCFSHGQLYVAISRVGHPDRVHVMAPSPSIQNVVFPDIFRGLL